MPLTISKKRIFIVLSLTILGLGLFSFVRKPAVLAQNDSGNTTVPLTCPLNKEAPLGQLFDQTSSTVGKISENLGIMLQEVGQEIKAAKRMVELADSCKTDNCQASCSPGSTNTPRGGTPTTSCTSTNYSCTYQNETVLGADSSISNINCGSLPGNTLPGFDLQKYYAKFQWKELTSAYPCNPHTCDDPDFNPSCQSGAICYPENVFYPGEVIRLNSFTTKQCSNFLLSYDCITAGTCDDDVFAIYQYDYYGTSGWCNAKVNFDPNRQEYCDPRYQCDYKDYVRTGREIVGNKFSRKDCKNISNDLNILNDEGHSYAIYEYVNKSNSSDSGLCNVPRPSTTCYDTCYNTSGDCSIEWNQVNPSCTNNLCTGNACNFGEINNQINIISQSTQTISNSNQVITDIFGKKVAELPLLGDICQIPGLGVVCNLCNIIGNIITGCKTEIETILSLFQKSIGIMKDCYNDPADFEKILAGEKSGKSLMRCQDLIPTTFEKCYFDNYYCCQF